VTEPTLHRLEGLSPRAFQHPADRAATAALGQVPGLERTIRKLTEFQYERALRQVMLASSVKVGPRQLPELWDLYRQAVSTLDVSGEYDVYVTQYPLANAAVIGAGSPILVLSSHLVDLLEPDELWSVLGHELGHVLCDHVAYQTALLVLLGLGSGAPLLARLPLRAVRTALLEWYRAAELSADRAGALACRDPVATCRSLMVVAAGLPSRRLDLDAFLQQVAEYDEWESGWDKVLRLLAERQGSHPFSVRRVRELTDWVRAGEYDRILGGHYVRHGDSDVRADAGAAYEHYLNRFWTLFREATEGADSARSRLEDWLDRRGGGDG
jgi:Zn-dependent protease with chaperone function